jgi:hypothetical protein
MRMSPHHQAAVVAAVVKTNRKSEVIRGINSLDGVSGYWSGSEFEITPAPTLYPPDACCVLYVVCCRSANIAPDNFRVIDNIDLPPL